MRTICDVCESAPAVLFCAADEAALCQSCDDKVHMCNKLASRHVRVRLADPSDVPLCDICENSPAFFYCEIDGSSLCLQCDMTVHVGGKRTHARYLLLRQRAEFPGINKPDNSEDMADTVNDTKDGRLPNPMTRDALQMQHAASESNAFAHGSVGNKMIDLNAWPRQAHGQPSSTQGKEAGAGDGHGEGGGPLLGPFEGSTEMETAIKL